MAIIIMDKKQKRIVGVVVGVTAVVIAAFLLKNYVCTSCKNKEKPANE